MARVMPVGVLTLGFTNDHGLSFLEIGLDQTSAFWLLTELNNKFSRWWCQPIY